MKQKKNKKRIIGVPEARYRQAIRDRERLIRLKKLQQKQNSILSQIKVGKEKK